MREKVGEDLAGIAWDITGKLNEQYGVERHRPEVNWTAEMAGDLALVSARAGKLQNAEFIIRHVLQPRQGRHVCLSTPSLLSVCLNSVGLFVCLSCLFVCLSVCQFVCL